MLRKVTREELSNVCDPSDFSFSTTEELDPLKETIGQKRALSSLDFGLGIDRHGFNIYILGESGTGKMTSIKTILQNKAKNEPTPNDWCYVYNFRNPDEPKALSMSPGTVESKEYEKQRTKIIEDFQHKQKSLFSELEQTAKENDFSLRKTATGLALGPIKKTGETLSEEEFEALNVKAKKKIETIGKELQEKLDDVIRVIRGEEKKVKERMIQLERQATLSSVGHRIDEIKSKHKDNKEVIEYLGNVKEDILDHLDDFKPQDEQSPTLPFLKPIKTEPSLIRYTINVFVNNTDVRGAPVVVESNPNYFNLFGRIEHKLHYGIAMTDFSMIKAGSLQKANGGYLITDSFEMLKSIFVYDALKRAIKGQEIKIEDVWEQYRLISTVTLRPEAIPFNVKIILVGNPYLYYLLYNLDEEYRELFKVKADFENRMDRNRENILKFASFVRTKCEEKGILHFDREAVALVVEFASRLAEHKHKLSAKFTEVADLMREADYWAKRDKKSIVTAEDVEKALSKKTYRVNKVEKKILESIKDGTILVDTEGAVAGQVNGLSMIDLGDYRFGTPSRITAKVYAGKAGIVNIERETKMSGKIHEKAVLILTAYLGGKYATKRPLSLTASLTFEQLYGGIEGDSATCAEVYALLSSISGIPLKQSFAITGSMNQHGEVQPIGGVNEKIEGFFEVCKLRGLNGDHVVIIPGRNILHLMLKSEVREAVTEGKFSIFAIDNIEEGIEPLTGMPAGEVQEDGSYPGGTFNFLVAQKLEELSEALKEEKEEEGKEEK
jgi:lon-related putative ATP-dependent protease